MAAISSPANLKSKTSMFSAIRLGFMDFGMTERPCSQAPSQHHLGWGLAVFGGDATDDWVIEGACMVASDQPFIPHLVAAETAFPALAVRPATEERFTRSPWLSRTDRERTRWHSWHQVGWSRSSVDGPDGARR